MNADHDANPADMFATAWDVFRRIVDNCPVGIFTADVSGRHVFVNRQWSVLTGVSRDKAVGRGWERAVHPEDVRAVTSQWRQLVTEGDELTVQIRLLRPDGSARTAILRAAAVVGENGHRRFAGTLTAVPDDSASAPTGIPADGLDAVAFERGSGSALGEQGSAAPETAGIDSPIGDDLDDLGSLCSETIELLRDELERFDVVTDDLWYPSDGVSDHDRPGWAVPAPRRPLSAEFDPPFVDPPFDRPFPEPPFKDPFKEPPFAEPPFTGQLPGPARARSTGPGSTGPVVNGGRDGADPAGADPSRADSAGADGQGFPSYVPRSGSARGGALPPGAEWRAAVSPHGALPGPPPPVPGRAPEAGGRPPGAFWRPVPPQRSEPLITGPPGAHHASGDGACGCVLSEVRRLSDACHERERWLTTLLAELPSAVLVADADAQVVAVNQAYCDLFELAESPVDLVGTDCRTQMRPIPGLVEDPAGFASRLDTLLRRRRTTRREAVMFADGRVFERSHIPLAGPNGYHGHLWLYVDVTDRRIVEAEIEGLISGL
ncbi:putative PAS/PAC sensor protein [Parafrankia sp. Ea1.12]|uniref:PAS domain-containing protein n=1 Tax=Parafrankia sp. Ea1.12 TaxID=573499 RepID=UPI000DA5887F|nr:PAS domain-containing protein [Parafrankia sp. Ea1.12]SQD99443.1 putative PAS/PAC sensor protein [Parafrankia sp. Ea1.12]